MDRIKGFHVRSIQGNELAVLIDARRRHRLGENRRVPREVVTQQHRSRPDVVLLCDLEDTLVLEQRRSGAAERAIRSDVDALPLAEIDNFLLGEQRVVFDLVGCGRDGCLCQ